MDFQPLVSVLMTSYNREKYIDEAITSVLTSTYTNFELIIVDDCSTDNTVNIAKSFEAKDKKVKVYVNDRNLGQFPNRNKAAGYATGEYLINVDSDDTILPNGIQDLINIMGLYPESSFGMHAPEYDTITVIPPKTAIRDHFFKKQFLVQGPGATILRRDFFNEIGKYPVDYGIPGDMFFNLKACCYTHITVIPFEFMFYRLHKEQESNNSYDYLYNNYKYMCDALDTLPLGLEVREIKWLHKKSKRRFTMNIIKYFLMTFNFKKTALAIKKANFSLGDALVGIFH